MKNMIRAGIKSEISAAERWLILDIGCANKSASCGLPVNEPPPVILQFAEAKKRICKYISASKEPVNLLIEAPLSVAFDNQGNPKGRKVDKQGSQTRYWYVSPGSTVLVAALYLMKAVSEIQPDVEVRLFEGLVSFKEKGKKSNHGKDVMLLREIINNPEKYPDSIIDPGNLKMDPSDTSESAFSVVGIDGHIEKPQWDGGLGEGT